MGRCRLFVIAQFIRPNYTNPSADPALDFVLKVETVLRMCPTVKAACYDCHSNYTTWPWYSQVAPISWLVANHVNEGREHLNFSTLRSCWVKKAHAYEEMVETIKEGEMPMKGYVLLHSAAKLDDARKQALLEWCGARMDGGESFRILD